MPNTKDSTNPSKPSPPSSSKNQSPQEDINNNNNQPTPTHPLSNAPTISQRSLEETFDIIDLDPTQIDKIVELAKETSMVHIERKHLNAVPTEISQSKQLQKSLQVLALPSNRITEIPFHLQHFQALRMINLRRNKLTAIPKPLHLLNQLIGLDLSGNQIDALPKGACLRWSQLSVLNLKSNQITELPGELGNMTSLTVLNIADNRLKRLPNEVRRLTNLKELYVHDNYVDVMDYAALGRLRELRVLLMNRNRLNHSRYMSKHRLKEDEKTFPLIHDNTPFERKHPLLFHGFPDREASGAKAIENNQNTDEDNSIAVLYENLVQLKELDISYNYFETEDMYGVGSMFNLVSLKMSSNRIQWIPFPQSKIDDNMKELSFVDISRNQLNQFPLSLCAIGDVLLSLNLSNNQIPSLPNNRLSQFFALKVLLLKSNKLTVIPKSLRQLKSLQTIDLSHNEISTIEPKVFFPPLSDTLEELNLSNNHITELQSAHFCEKFKKLVRIDLSYNSLKQFPANVHHCESLRSLNLEHNRIVTIPRTFHTILRYTKFRKLNIAYNCITHLPRSFVFTPYMDYLFYLHYKGNPFEETLKRGDYLAVLSPFLSLFNRYKELGQMQVELEEFRMEHDIDIDDPCVGFVNNKKLVLCKDELDEQDIVCSSISQSNTEHHNTNLLETTNTTNETNTDVVKIEDNSRSKLLVEHSNKQMEKREGTNVNRSIEKKEPTEKEPTPTTTSDKKAAPSLDASSGNEENTVGYETVDEREKRIIDILFNLPQKEHLICCVS